MKWFEDLLNSVSELSDSQKIALTTSFNKEFPLNAVPKEQYTKKTDELKAASDQLDTTNTQIEDLKKSSESTDILKTQLEKITTDFNDFKSNTEKRETNSTKLGKLKEHLSTKFSPDAIDLIANTFDLDKLVQSENGNIVDIETKMEELASSRPTLVISKVPGTPPPKSGDTPPGEVDTTKMTDAEYYAQVRATKEKA